MKIAFLSSLEFQLRGLIVSRCRCSPTPENAFSFSEMLLIWECGVSEQNYESLCSRLYYLESFQRCFLCEHSPIITKAFSVFRDEIFLLKMFKRIFEKNKRLLRRNIVMKRRIFFSSSSRNRWDKLSVSLTTRFTWR